jgi:Uma2 family endonuclease
LRRYQAMTRLRKAELIEGVVYIPSPDVPPSARGEGKMASPVSAENHSAPHFDLIGWLAFYRSATPGLLGGDNGTVRLDLHNVVQPDAMLLIRESHGGQSCVGEDGYLAGAPELVAEIAYSGVSKDLHEKLDIYRRTGAREYVVWRVEDRVIDWYILREGRYDRVTAGEDGLHRSEVLPGLWLDAEALIRGDLAAVFGVVQRGTATPEHAAFVERLRRAGPQP